MKEVPLLDLMKDDNGYDRKFKRYWVNFPMSVQAAAEEAAPSALSPKASVECLPALTHNISLSGIAFVCAGHYDNASLIEIDIPLAGQTHFLLARVRRRRQLDLPGEPMYHYGTQFLRTEAVLQFIPIAAEFLLAQGSDRRTGRSHGMSDGLAPMEPQETPA